MSNLLLRHCREAAGIKQQAIQQHSGIAIKRYRQIERSAALPSWEETVALGKLFNIKPNYLYQHALQLEQLKTSRELLQYHKQQKLQTTITS